MNLDYVKGSSMPLFDSVEEMVGYLAIVVEVNKSRLSQVSLEVKADKYFDGMEVHDLGSLLPRLVGSTVTSYVLIINQRV